MVDKNFVKGYFRQALALQNMDQIENAIEATKRGLGIDSGNVDLKKMARELEETLRMKKVDAAVALAQSQLKADEINEAFRTVDGALRLDPENKKLQSLMSDIQPKRERLEKQRLAGLNPNERIKEEGDVKFKAADFEGAIKKYTQCLDAITDKSSDLAMKCYGNRAACNKQLSNFDGTIEDCTYVLEHRPDDVKALVRRAQALEACERYKSAMQDVRQVLAYGPETCGKASYDLANGMQHRLTRLIQQLKNG
jgi:stress-induced-phosphoprotein 1